MKVHLLIHLYHGWWLHDKPLYLHFIICIKYNIFSNYRSFHFTIKYWYFIAVLLAFIICICDNNIEEKFLSLYIQYNTVYVQLYAVLLLHVSALQFFVWCSYSIFFCKSCFLCYPSVQLIFISFPSSSALYTTEQPQDYLRTVFPTRQWRRSIFTVHGH